MLLLPFPVCAPQPALPKSSKALPSTKQLAHAVAFKALGLISMIATLHAASRICVLAGAGADKHDSTPARGKQELCPGRRGTQKLPYLRASVSS